jgi:signal transduction histidine kinase
VRDSGTGMPAAVRSKAFELFFTTREDGRGTGLGLPMVHGFVHQSGGFLTLRSASGVGTTLSLYLPAIAEAADAAAPSLHDVAADSWT